MHFACTSEDVAGAVVVTPFGEVDRDTAPRLREVLDNAARKPPASVEVELQHVTFLDSSGISVLLAGQRQAVTAGMSFRIRNPTDNVRTVLEITDVLDLLSGG